MELSIVILHHGNAKAATRSLQALTKAWLPDQTEVFVVNNGKPGCNPEIPFDGDFDLHYLEIENRGYPQGNNVAMQRAKGKFLCILTDVVVEPATFKILLGYLQDHPQVGIVAPRLVYPEGGVQDNYRVFPRLLVQLIKRTFLRRWFLPQVRHYLMWDKDPQKSEAVDWLTGAMQVFTRECWEKIGPKDERYFLFMSDVDICRTAWDHGFEVHFVGETQATHEQARLSGGGILDVFRKKSVRIHIVDAMKYYWKYRGRKIPKTQ
jgi:GT2 family glycosyltransferase